MSLFVSEVNAIEVSHYVWVAGSLFIIGLAGLIVRRNVLILYMSMELMLSAVSILMVTFSRYSLNLDGSVFMFFIITVAAAEVAIGLALIVALFKEGRSLYLSGG